MKWDCMTKGEKPGGHGERCVAVGTLDMAVRDAVAKIAERPLYRFLAGRTGSDIPDPAVQVYAGCGYYFPPAIFRAWPVKFAAFWIRVTRGSKFKKKPGFLRR